MHFRFHKSGFPEKGFAFSVDYWRDFSYSAGDHEVSCNLYFQASGLLMAMF